MEGQAVLANGARPDSLSHGDTLELDGSESVLSLLADKEKGRGNGNLADEVLEDLDEYWDDIQDRLIISRMVSVSVIKGMVTAKEQEAAEKITSMELELANLKEFLNSRKVCSPTFGQVRGIQNCGKCSCLPWRRHVKNENLREELHTLRNSGIEQLINIKKEIDFATTCNSLRKIEFDSEGVGLGGNLPEKQPQRWVHMDKLLENLERTMDIVCTKADGLFLSCCELLEERDLLANIEGIVIETVLKRLKEESEDKLWNGNSQLSRIQSVNWLGKFQELSNLGARLDTILRSLSIHDSGLVAHGSHDMDYLHHKALNDHVNTQASSPGENEKLDDANIHVAEIYDFQQLKHLSKEELVGYFNDIIIKMKRDHESALHQKTEEYFRLKREYLKERSSFLTHRKDEEFDVLRKKIPEVISKLEDFLVENERFPALACTAESIEKMKDRIESLLSENHQLRDRLTDKENEVKHLEEQAADAAAQLLQHSLSEETTLQLVGNLNSAVEESRIEASLKEEVFKCGLREQIAETRHDLEDSHMEFLFTEEIYDIILRGAIITSETTNKDENEDSDIETLITDGFHGLMCAEAIKDAEKKLNDLTWEILRNKDVITCLEVKALEKENQLRQVFEEKENLKQEILSLGTTVGQKEKLASDLSSSLSKEREQLELASQELHRLREHASQQQTLVTESNRELQLLRSEHLEALEQIQIDKIEMHKLNQMLDETKELLTEANQQRNIAFSCTQEMHEKLYSVEAREEKLKKEVEMAVSGFSKMFNDFECSVSGAIIKNNLRLEHTRSHLKALNGTANSLKRTGQMHRQRLERKFADLKMAEAEVDLLGDEVDTLMRLLEKIYVGLDHYSPVLKHYPGIIDILKLVRRELTGESSRML